MSLPLSVNCTEVSYVSYSLTPSHLRLLTVGRACCPQGCRHSGLACGADPQQEVDDVAEGRLALPACALADRRAGMCFKGVNMCPYRSQRPSVLSVLNTFTLSSSIRCVWQSVTPAEIFVALVLMWACWSVHTLTHMCDTHMQVPSIDFSHNS